MGKMTVGEKGIVKIKMDTPDSIYFDAKEPHVSLVKKDETVVRHLNLYNIDDTVGFDRETKAAIEWVRDHKQELIDMYNNRNPYKISG